MPMATQSTTAGFHQFSGFNSSLLLVRTSYFTSGRQPNHPNCSCHLFKGLALTKIWLLEMFQFDSTGVGVSRLPYSYFGICICQFHDKYQSYKYERNTAGKSARWGWGGGRGPTLIPTFYWERLTHLVWILRNVTNTQKFSSKNTSHICGGFKAF